MGISEDYLICRCEEISLEALRKAKEIGATTSQEVKMATRAGMGMCQGRICRSLLEQFTSENVEGFCESPSKLTIHHPARPVPIGVMAFREE